MSEPPISSPPPSAPPPPPPGPPYGAAPPPAGGSSNRTLMIVLAYLGIFAVIPLVVEKDDPELQWHAKHGLVLFGAWIALGILLSIVNTALSAIFPALGCLGCVLGLALTVAIVVVHVMAIMKGLKGERFLVPGLSDLANKF